MSLSRFTTILALLTVLAVSPGSTPSARANSFKEVPIDSLWVHADCVIEATVLGWSSGWTPDSSGLHTWIQVDVTTVHAGLCTVGPRTLEFWAGETDSLSVVIENMPTFTVGERVFLFLSEQPGMVCPVLGLDMGKFTITTDPATGRDRVVNRHYGALSRGAMLGAGRARTLR